jgi:uncharacterized damage-inducible protein DinB
MSNPALTALFEHKAWCNRGFIAALRAASAEADRRLMAVAVFTLDHTSIVDQLFKARLAGEPEPAFTEVVASARPDLDVLAATMAATDAWYLDYVAHASPAELDQLVEFTYLDGDPGRMTKAQMLAHVITHGASHRGAINKTFEGTDVRGSPAERAATGGGMSPVAGSVAWQPHAPTGRLPDTDRNASNTAAAAKRARSGASTITLTPPGSSRTSNDRKAQQACSARTISMTCVRAPLA